jgi:putative hydrolase of the HAD superfamily
MFTLACFDLDNTLFDHDIAEQAAYANVLSYLDKTLDITCSMDDIIQAKQQVKQLTHTYERTFYIKNILIKHNAPNLLKHLTICHDLYWNTFLENTHLFPYVKETLMLFPKRKIITNFTLAHQLKKCKHLGILDLFDDILTSEEFGTTKPSSTIFHQATLPHKKEKCCMIGDRPHEDILGAKQVGMFTILLDRHRNIPIHIAPMQLTVASFEELHRFFTNILENLTTFLTLCHRVGERSDFTQHTGGNVSIKWNHEGHHLMIIKASGCHLADITKTSGWSLLLINETNFTKIYGEQPSIETSMHITMKQSIVLHCHPPIPPIPSIPTIPYVPPGQLLADSLKPYCESPMVYLENHGIVVQGNNATDTLSLLDTCRSFKSYSYCNTISTFMQGGITLLSKEQHANPSNQFFTPDTAVFLCGIFTSLEEAKQSRHERFVLVHNSNLYCHAPTHTQAKAMLELLDVHLQLSKLGLSPLSDEECKKLQTRPDEKHRVNM